VFLPEEGVRRGSLLPRKFLLGIGRDPDYASLREDTVLDPFRSTLAAMQMGEMILEWLRSGDGPGEKALMREWETDRAESDAEELSDESDTIEEIAGEEGARDKDKKGESGEQHGLPPRTLLWRLCLRQNSRAWKQLSV